MSWLGKKGQGDFLSGDMPALIMIVVSVGFFLSSIYLAQNEFQSKKGTIDMEAALVEAASTFLKENAKIRADDVTSSTSEFWSEKLEKITRTYGVNVYVELMSLDPNAPVCTSPKECTNGDEPADNINTLSKRFPIALKGDTDLDVYPALIKVYVYRS
jgi:hypothetical protein